MAHEQGRKRVYTPSHRAKGFPFCPIVGEHSAVRLVYIDETGLSKPSEEPFLVVSGVIVDADKRLGGLERHIASISDRYIPPNLRKGFVFHASELFNARGRTFKRDDPYFTLERRLEIADRLAAIPKRFHLPLTFGIVERKNFPKTFNASDFTTGGLTVAAHVTAFMSCAMQVERWMRRMAAQEVCLLIIEDNQQAKKLITDTQLAYQDRHLIAELSERERKNFPFRKIKEAHLFALKGQSKVLQLADFCAYVLKRHLMGDPRYARFFDPMREQLAVHPSDRA